MYYLFLIGLVGLFIIFVIIILNRKNAFDAVNKRITDDVKDIDKENVKSVVDDEII